ncbi:kinase-like protein [Cucurbitaria berberidis CBS 394.84]|uniref:Kinase-like protein n=1 Tax=Cucurbitaria berberidis CBS 394.84 TaxID=1168544 RepID=A0A9P4GRJ7_9PLEO|nr:kinase-like protein [Cucurbitaria berberidis CBS 394.84]KAF1850517.1 kinase-like protein [Cucurbitaria berberidis CBS 394.84]
MSAPTFTRAAALTRVLGQSGRRYLVERVLQDKPGNQGRVYLATSGDEKYVLKSVAPHDFKYFKDMFDDLRISPYVRVSHDAIPDKSIFAYRYLRDHLLSFVQKEIPLSIIKRILWDTLRGISALHDKGIVHTDIKANNILIEWKERGGQITVEQVQVADIEDAAYVLENCFIKGRQCIYAITKRVILAVDEEKVSEEIEILDIVLERQLSYFSDLEGIAGLIRYLGGSPWAQFIALVAADFNADNPRRPFGLWQDIDPDFKDLVVRIMNVDPTRRLTASEALAHTWFADVP